LFRRTSLDKYTTQNSHTVRIIHERIANTTKAVTFTFIGKKVLITGQNPRPDNKESFIVFPMAGIQSSRLGQDQKESLNTDV
jgi:hypothetical protein